MKNIDTSKKTWDLTPLFKNDEDPAIEKERGYLQAECERFANRWEERTDYLEDPAVLKEALEEYEMWLERFGTSGNQGYYLGLREAQEQTNPKIKAQVNKISDLATKLQNKVEFFTIRISKIPTSEQTKFLNYEGLKKYRHLLERLFATARYVLSEPEEKIMNLKQKTSFSNWTRLTGEFLSKELRNIPDEKGRTGKKSFEQLLSLQNNKNKTVREAATNALENIFATHIDFIEAEINTVCENLKVDCEIRGYDRPDKPRHVADDIDSEIVDVLVKTVTGRFDLPKRFYRLKAKLLGLNYLKYSERELEYGSITKKQPYDKAVNLVHETFDELDKEISAIFKKFVESGQIDVFPKKGKSNGAFCACERKTSPVYILLNYTNKLNDVLTIAHETGHGINDELMKKEQTELNFGTPLSTAEVASTFMEDFVLQKLLQKAKDKEKLSLMVVKLGRDMSTIFRQIAFYNFEWELHKMFKEKGYLTHKEIGRLFKKHMKAYLGRTGNSSENWWVYINHFRASFYVYSYASGLLISKSLQSMVKKNPSAVGKVKELMSCGLSKSPKEIFKELGIDITDEQFWQTGLLEIEKLLEEAEKLASKLDRIASRA